jgi:S1-C subfamily serine protease
MIDGKVVRDIDQIRRAVRSRKVGDAMRLTIWRSGQKRDVTILLEAMPEGYEKQVPNATAPDGVMRMP